jgi:hypothetical protein
MRRRGGRRDNRGGRRVPETPSQRWKEGKEARGKRPAICGPFTGQIGPFPQLKAEFAESKKE